MPRISQFLGIIISMYYDDHAPPHFHVKYAEYRAKVDIATLEIQEGQLPRRVFPWFLNGRRCVGPNCGPIGNGHAPGCRWR